MYDPKEDIYQKTVTTTVQKIVDYANNRIGILIFNNGASNFEVSRTPNFVYGQGLPIISNFAYSWNIFRADDTTNPVYAICGAATVDARIVEVIDRSKKYIQENIV